MRLLESTQSNQMNQHPSAQDVLNFWFGDEMSHHWFTSTPEIDNHILKHYQTLWLSASRSELDQWQQTPEGCLALVIVLDQLPLNMFRGQAKSFQTEQRSVAITRFAIEKGFDKQIAKDRVGFLYMPLMHSENLEDQDLSVRVFEQAGLDDNAKFAEHHRDIIRRFGRFPHRNKALGRQNTEAEREYLASDEAFTG